MTLDRTDLHMARVAVAWYVRAHHLHRRPVPPAAYRLADRLDDTLAADGHQPVVPQPHWLTTAQAATRLGCSTRQARRIAEKVGRRIGRQWLIPDDALPQEELWTTNRSNNASPR